MKTGLLNTASRLVLAPPSDEGAAIVVVAPGGGGDEAPAEAAEPIAEAAVEIARIEGETAVRLAVIEAETSIEHHELAAEADAAFGEALADGINQDLQGELEQCRSRIAELEAENSELRASWTPPPSPEAPPSPPAEAEAESLAPIVESPAAPEQALLPPEPPKRRKPGRWI